MEQGICPIIYIDPLSYTTKAMTDALGAYTKIWSEGLKDDKDYPDLFNALERLMLFSKPYVGPFEHNSQKDSEKIFYDEREWRFVPDLTKTKIRQLIYSSDPEFLDARDKNINLLKNNSEFSISITPSNIKYIIVENEDDIKPVMRKIEDSFGDQKYTPNAMQKLMTKIITTKQIREDF